MCVHMPPRPPAHIFPKFSMPCGPKSVRRISSQASLARSEEHTSELQSRPDLVCRLLLEKKKKNSLPPLKQDILSATAVPHKRDDAQKFAAVEQVTGHYWPAAITRLHCDSLPSTYFVRKC